MQAVENAANLQQCLDKQYAAVLEIADACKVCTTISDTAFLQRANVAYRNQAVVCVFQNKNLKKRSITYQRRLAAGIVCRHKEEVSEWWYMC
jgi:recombinational DNA repair protein RecR